ncbi:MAG: hypothetical protein ACHQD8_03900 [Chitinophagales bacterium]
MSPDYVVLVANLTIGVTKNKHPTRIGCATYGAHVVVVMLFLQSDSHLTGHNIQF